jgi:hypothetical protein
MRLFRHPEVVKWLTDLDKRTRAMVDESLSYLGEHGRAATLPDVRHRIQTSRHFPEMSEVRIDIDRDHVYRLLVGFGTDETLVLLLVGNKAGIGNHWYVESVPVADERFDSFLSAQEKSKEQPR